MYYWSRKGDYVLFNVELIFLLDRFVMDMYIKEERPETEEMISEIPLLIPSVSYFCHQPILSCDCVVILTKPEINIYFLGFSGSTADR